MKQFSGVCPAIVVDNVDPDNSGRVKVQLSMVSADEKAYEPWARIAAFMAGKNRGGWFIPDVNDEVLVAFEAGDVRRPYVVGGLWSNTNPPPETAQTHNNKKVLRSRNGVKITLDDQSGRESFIVETPDGQRIMLTDAPPAVEISDSNGNSIKLATTGMIVNCAAKVTINASTVEINSGTVSVNAGMSTFSGVVQCDTLISNSVVSASYTPGAGNLY